MAQDVKFVIENGAEFAAKLRQIGAAMAKQALERAVEAGALTIEGAAKTKSPLKTGTLRRSIHTAIADSSPTHATANIGTNLIYAKMQEYGGVVVPVKAKMLHWVDSAGKDVFAHKVTVPAHPYMRPAFDENHREAAKEMAAALEDTLKKAL